MRLKRSRKLRRVFVRTPGGKLKLMAKRRKPKVVKCAICKKPLHGIKRLVPYKKKRLSKSKKRPERSYGGFLCAGCNRERIKGEVRKVG